LAYGCAFGAPFQGRPTGGAKIGTECSKIATGRSASAGMTKPRDDATVAETHRTPGEPSMTEDVMRRVLVPALAESNLHHLI
jgi:hypothetical protein